MAWLLVALVSSLPLVLPALGGSPAGADVVPGASRFGLVLLPWLAWAGIPRRGAGVSWAFPLALALPLLGLAAGLDRARGTLALGWERGGALLLAGPLLVILWRAAAHAARGSARARGLQGLAWLLWVPMGAGLHAALSWAPLPRAGDPAAAGGAWELAAHWQPLVWCAEWTAADRDLADASRGVPLLLGATLALLGLVRWVAARAPDPSRGGTGEAEVARAEGTR